MKKLFALLLVAAMVLGMAACGAPSNTTTTAGTDAAGTETTAPAKVDTASMTPEEKAAAEAEIRNAISLLYDRNYIVEEIGQAGQVPASSFVSMALTAIGMFPKTPTRPTSRRPSRSCPSTMTTMRPPVSSPTSPP